MKGFVKYCLILAVVMSFNSSTLWAQGFHFSQYFNAPLYTNPANTGFISEYDYRIGAHLRSQGAAGLNIYKTNSIYGDMQILREKIAAGWVGIGGMILQDEAGKGKLRSTKISASVAYHQMLGFSGLLSAGFGLAYANKAITIDRLSFADQWNGRFFESKTPPNLGAQFTGQNTGYFDWSAGINYAHFPNDNFYLHTGLALQHINRPSESFFDYSRDSTKIPMRTTFFMDAMYKVDNRIIVSPNIYYSNKAKTSEFLLGAHANVNVSGDGRQQLIAGLYTRVGDAVIPVVGYQFGRFKFSFTFDLPLAGNKALIKFNGTELYMQYGGMYSVMSIKNNTMCPSFD